MILNVYVYVHLQVDMYNDDVIILVFLHRGLLIYSRLFEIYTWEKYA